MNKMNDSWDLPFVRTYDANDTVFEEGEPGTEMFIVLSGSVAIRRRTGTDFEEVARLEQGEFFGEMAVVDRNPRSASAFALEDGTRLMAVDAARFVYLVSQQPGFALLVMKTLSMRQRGAKTPGRRSASRSGSAVAYELVPIDERSLQLRSRTRSCNAYLLKGSKRNVLIDTGLPSSKAALLGAIADAGLSGSDIDMVVLTHEHFDHIAAVSAFGGRPVVAAHALAANKLHLDDDFATMRRAFDEPGSPVAVDWELTDGTVINTGSHRLRIYHTPGHSSGSIGLLDQDTGMMFCGDTVLKGGSIGGIFGSGNISDLIASLDLIKTLNPTVLLPGHGTISKRPMSDIEATLERCRMLMHHSEGLFDAMQANENVNHLIKAFRDLNRGFERPENVGGDVPSGSSE